jgi:hypothetical protein
MTPGQGGFPVLKQPCPIRVTLDVLEQNRCVFIAEIYQAGFAKPVSFAILRLRERDLEVWQETPISMAHNHHKNIASAYFVQARFDRKISSRTKKLHGVGLKVKPPDGVKHTFALDTQVRVGAAKKNCQWPIHNTLGFEPTVPRITRHPRIVTSPVPNGPRSVTNLAEQRGGR